MVSTNGKAPERELKGLLIINLESVGDNFAIN